MTSKETVVVEGKTYKRVRIKNLSCNGCAFDLADSVMCSVELLHDVNEEVNCFVEGESCIWMEVTEDDEV